MKLKVLNVQEWEIDNDKEIIRFKINESPTLLMEWINKDRKIEESDSLFNTNDNKTIIENILGREINFNEYILSLITGYRNYLIELADFREISYFNIIDDPKYHRIDYLDDIPSINISKKLKEFDKFYKIKYDNPKSFMQAFHENRLEIDSSGKIYINIDNVLEPTGETIWKDLSIVNKIKHLT